MITATQIAALSSHFSSQPDVVAVYVYGSHARGSDNKLSDIDIAVMLENVSTHTSRLHLDAIGAMTEIFHTDDVDVQILSPQTPPVLAVRMMNGALVYCRSLEKKTSIEAQILSRYQDFEPFMRLQTDEMEKRLKEDSYASG